jgi:cell division protease FtsH
VDLEVLARGTPGFSGADLANLVNEAAINAAHANRDFLVAADFDEARDRVILGRREGSNVLLPDEKEAVAVHEAGHALVAAMSPKADPVAKVTILPAGQALGVTEQLPLTDRHLYGEDYLYDSLAVRLGGRAAELVELGQGSTGAANDLASATELAVRMVREFGLSKGMGPVGYPEGGPAYLGGSGGQGFSTRPFAEETQAVDLLTKNRTKLRQLADLLIAKETVDGAEVYEIAGVDEPDRIEEGATMAPARAATSVTPGPLPGPVAVAKTAGEPPPQR